MGLSTTPRPLFSQKWVDGLAPVPESAMAGRIRIYDPSTSEATYNPVTNTYESNPVVVYEGKARLQPLRTAGFINNNANDSINQALEVQIPIGTTKSSDFRPKLRLKILESPLNPSLLGFMGALREVLDSSNPFERTLVFDVNVESTDG